MMWGYDGFGGGWTMGIGMLLFWGVIIFALLAAVRGFGRPWGGRGGEFMPRERTAIEILRERYARGEVDKADFEARLRDLQKSGAGFWR